MEEGITEQEEKVFIAKIELLEMRLEHLIKKWNK